MESYDHEITTVDINKQCYKWYKLYTCSQLSLCESEIHGDQ
jgi:hypothetical protein